MSIMVPQTGMAWMDTLEGVASHFVEHLTIGRDVSIHTVRAYGKDIAVFLQWLRQTIGLISSADQDPLLSELELCRYVETYNHHCHQRTPALKPATLARTFATLRSFFKYAVRHHGFASTWLTLPWTNPKQPAALPHFLTQQDCEQLLNALSTLHNGTDDGLPLESTQTPDPLDSVLLLRNRAILLTLFTAGLRVGELTGLRWDDMDTDEGTLKVLGKGSRERLAFISPDTVEAITQYREQWHVLLQRNRQRFPKASQCKQTIPLPTDSIWLSHTGRPLSARSVARMLAQLGKHTGLSQVVHPHIFRHSFATHLLNHNVDLRVVQELLGHVSIRSTQVYTHLQTRRLRQAYQSAHPRAQIRAKMTSSSTSSATS